MQPTRLMLTLMFLLISANPCYSAAANQQKEARIEKLVSVGNQFRLRGDFEKANLVRDQLLSLFPDDPAGNVFNLNTIVTQLSWDESQTQFDEALVKDATRTLNWCESALNAGSSIARSNYYCGVAHFSLSYYQGIRGSYLRAGREGSESIDYLEAALAADPSLMRAKMFLGVAYYYADNLPAFIRMMSRILWFIPTGNSEKSLPYLKAVMASKDEFRDVAQYIYVTLLLNGDAKQSELALTELQSLVNKYPENTRFQLRFVSALVDHKEFARTIAQVNNLLSEEYSGNLSQIDRSLIYIWGARAYLGLGDMRKAAELQADINLQEAQQSAPVPVWSLAWYWLSEGQLADLKGNRNYAVDAYKNIIALSHRAYVSPVVLSAAKTGIIEPFKGAW